MGAAEQLQTSPDHRDWTPVYENEHATVLMHEDDRSSARVVPRARYRDVSEMDPLKYRDLIKIVGRTARSLMTGCSDSTRVGMSFEHAEGRGGRHVYLALRTYDPG